MRGWRGDLRDTHKIPGGFEFRVFLRSDASRQGWVQMLEFLFQVVQRGVLESGSLARPARRDEHST